MLTQDDNAKALLGDGPGQGKSSTKHLNPPEQSLISQQSSKSHKKQKNKSKKKKDDTQFTSVLKVFNIIVGLCVTGFGVVCYMFFSDSLKQLDYVGFILPGYIALSGFLILLIELNIRIITRNMKFLYNYFGRGLFNIYVGVMPLCLIRDDNKQSKPFQIIIIVMVSLMCLIGVLYILAKVLCCAKEGDKRKKRKYSSDSSSDSD